MKKIIIPFVIVLACIFKIWDYQSLIDARILTALSTSTLSLSMDESYFYIIFDYIFNFVFSVDIDNIYSFLKLIGR